MSGYTNLYLAVACFATATVWFRRRSADPVRRVISRLRGREPSPAHSERGYLDHLVDGMKMPGLMRPILDRMGKEISRMDPRIARHIAAMAQAQMGPDSAVRMHKCAAAAARDIEAHTKKMRVILDQFKPLGMRLSGGYIGVADLVRSRPVERETLASLREGIRSLMASTQRHGQIIEGYRSAIVGLRGISGDLNVASDNLAAVMGGFAEVTNSIRLACERLIPSIDDKLAG